MSVTAGGKVQAGANVWVALLIAAVAITGTANNFAGRIKAQILGDYNFVTVVPDSVLQLLFYTVAVGLQMRRKKVSARQLRYMFACGRRWSEFGAWKFLALAGVSDIANQVTGLSSQPHLSTFMMSLMDQATTPFTVLCSMLLLGTRYIMLEWAAILVILTSAVACVAIADTAADPDDSQFWALFAAATTSFAALSFVLKEISFAGFRLLAGEAIAPMALQVSLAPPGAGRGKTEPLLAAAAPPAADETLNVFLVSAFISFVGLLSCVPVALLNYSAVSEGSGTVALLEGLQVLWTRENAMLSYIVYLTVNTAFNLSLILTTSYGSALLSFLSLKMAVPLTAIFSSVNWPVIGAKPLNESEWIALLFVIGGISLFRCGNIKRQRRELAAFA